MNACAPVKGLQVTLFSGWVTPPSSWSVVLMGVVVVHTAAASQQHDRGSEKHQAEIPCAKCLSSSDFGQVPVQRRFFEDIFSACLQTLQTPTEGHEVARRFRTLGKKLKEQRVLTLCIHGVTVECTPAPRVLANSTPARLSYKEVIARTRL